MESRDGEGSGNMEASVPVPLALDRSLCVAAIGLPSSESEECSSRDSESISGLEQGESHRRPLVDRCVIWPMNDSSSSGQSLPGQFSSQERPSEPAHFSPEVSLEGSESSFTLASSSNDQACCPSQEAFALPQYEASATEQLQGLAQAGLQESSSLAEGDFQSVSNANSLERPPYEVCLEEDSHCTTQEPELSDDVKREMIADICKGVSIFSCRSESLGGTCHVYVIGTAHVSEESCREVQAAVHLIKPEVVFLELCHKRTSVLQRTPFVVPTMSDMISMWKQRKTNMLGIVYSWFLAKVAAKLDVRPGAEFRAAYEEALACGAKVVLGDRDIEVTLRRTWGKMSVWNKTKFILVLIYQSLFLPKADQLNELIEKLKDADILTLAFEELGKFSPTLMETVITERDLFMTAALQKIAEHHSSIVAVVGRGHVAGITKYWGQDIPIHTLLEIPQKTTILRLTLRTYVLIGLVAFASALVFAFH